MTTPLTLEELARRAIEGDPDVLDLVARQLQGDIYGLALRMLWNKEDAEDATQEVLVRVVTRLSQFDFRSRLKTWAYRVAHRAADGRPCQGHLCRRRIDGADETWEVPAAPRPVRSAQSHGTLTIR